MKQLLTALPGTLALTLSLGLALPGGAAFAQTQSEDSTSGTSTAQQIESQLSMGDDGEPRVGEPYTKEENGDWELRCIRVESGEDPCQAYQLLDDGQGSPVAEVSMFRLPDGGKAAAGATIIVPLETALPQQLQLKVDDGETRRYPFAFCNRVGCYARLGLTPEDVAAFKGGNVALVTIAPALAPEQDVVLELSLKGFTATYDKVSVVEQ